MQWNAISANVHNCDIGNLLDKPAKGVVKIL